MEKNKYKELYQKHIPKENRLLNMFICFTVGGIMGVIGQFLIEIYSYYLDISSKDAATLMIITLVFLGCLLTSLGFFDKMVTFCKCGLIVPITGFAHSMMSAALDYRREGMVTGLGASMFKLAGSVIIFGVVSAYLFGLLRIIVMGG
ncbi:MAG: SpoVA/SpoVAEb family sporulation membrane protein [Bacilli bacterium]|nr:SpoVA/SpoVAEb family sporulation membrane protein [Bacilli bacterium]